MPSRRGARRMSLLTCPRRCDGSGEGRARRRSSPHSLQRAESQAKQTTQGRTRRSAAVDEGARLDSGALVTLERADRRITALLAREADDPDARLSVPAAVLAQAWRQWAGAPRAAPRRAADDRGCPRGREHQGGRRPARLEQDDRRRRCERRRLRARSRPERLDVSSRRSSTTGPKDPPRRGLTCAFRPKPPTQCG